MEDLPDEPPDEPIQEDSPDDPPDEPIRVLVRVRPARPQDALSADGCPLGIRNGDTVTLTRKDRAVSVRFDAVLDGR
jgi:hypothetical protein